MSSQDEKPKNRTRKSGILAPVLAGLMASIPMQEGVAIARTPTYTVGEASDVATTLTQTINNRPRPSLEQAQRGQNNTVNPVNPLLIDREVVIRLENIDAPTLPLRFRVYDGDAEIATIDIPAAVRTQSLGSIRRSAREQIEAVMAAQGYPFVPESTSTLPPP